LGVCDRMKVCFDTSVLVAALLQQHPHHAVAFPRLRAVHEGRDQGMITAHALAELYATLTALPLKPRFSPADVQRLMSRSILPHFTVISLDSADYEQALNLAVDRQVTSGAIYDALQVVGARKMGCEQLLTLNLKHFRMLAPGDGLIVGP